MNDSKGELKRYDYGIRDDGLIEADDGDWVHWDDVSELLSALSTAEQRIEELEKEMDDLKTMYKSPYEMMARLRAEREKELRRFFNEGLIYRSMMPHSTTTAESKWFEKFLASQSEKEKPHD